MYKLMATLLKISCRGNVWERRRGKTSANRQNFWKHPMIIASNLRTSGDECYVNSKALKDSTRICASSRVTNSLQLWRADCQSFTLSWKCSMNILIKHFVRTRSWTCSTWPTPAHSGWPGLLTTWSRNTSDRKRWSSWLLHSTWLPKDEHCQRERAKPAPRQAQSLEYYFGSNLYDFTIDIRSVECFCAPSVVERLNSCSNPQTIGNERRRWKLRKQRRTSEPRRFCLGGCCFLFTSGKNPKKDSREIDRFIGTFKAAARQYGHHPDAEPENIGKVDPLDLTLGNQDDDDTMGPVRRTSRLLNLKPYKTGETFEISVENALIVVSRVVLTYGDALGYGSRKPAIVKLWLGNRFGRTLAIFEGEPPNGPLPYGAVEYGGKQQPAQVMRATILSLLGNSNFVVRFNVGWTLADLNLVLPGHRVVDLGTEPEFQHWFRRLTIIVLI